MFYARIKDGGLGFLRLENTIPVAFLQSVAKMKVSTDPVTRWMGTSSHLEERAVALATSRRINTPITVQSIKRAKEQLADKESKCGKH